MMATTHAFAGLTLVAPFAFLAPEYALPLAVGAIAGGVFPDVDVLFVHRRTLHFPVYGLPVAVAGAGFATVFPSSLTAAVGAFAVAAWVHAVSDAGGGGPEMDPWTNPSDRAVYDHARGTWVRPRRWIRYDGAPEDAVLAVALAITPLLVFDDPLVRGIVLGAVALSIGYAAVRRRLVEWLPERLE
ncbi:metal-dependent hydrolase [Natrialbaceae archaeon GCM10025810]|uniref:metal-dependent hydrolase n=1 Tax=Halovalidus salilacus TaxID=3075124 RepID=UPI00361310E7